MSRAGEVPTLATGSSVRHSCWGMLGALLLLTHGCGEESGIDPSLTPMPPEFVLESTVRIDGYAEDLVPIGPTALRGDGVLAFAQTQDGRVVFYDAAGTRLGTFGREGGGPGEFQHFSRMGWSADTLWVDDFRQSRTSWIAMDPEPRLLRSESWGPMSPTTALDGLPAFARASGRGWYADGSVFARLSGPEGDPPELEGEELYGRVGLDGELLGVVARYRDRENSVSQSVDRGSGLVATFAVGNPWIIETKMDSPGTADGLTVVYTEVESDSRVRLRVQRMSGLDTAWTRELEFMGVPITDAMADSAINAVVESMQDGFPAEFGDIRQHYLDNATVPEVLPPLRDIHAGADGSLWLRLHTLEGFDPESHLILDHDGNLTGRVVVEEGTVVEVGRDFAWLTVSDSLGVESLVRNRILPAG